MARIVIPGDELAEAIELLKRIRESLERAASLEAVGTESDVGDRGLAGAVQGFDEAWRKGQERVRDNTDTFRDMVDGILKRFADTDLQTVENIE